MSFTTADLYDEFSDKVQVGSPGFNNYGGRKKFSGPIVTLKVFEDNTLVRSTLEQEGDGKVLVVDGGGSLRCALLGDNLARLGLDNSWAGIIVSGCIRDSVVIAELDIGVKALGTNPRKSVKKGEGSSEIPVTFAGITFVPGEYLYADEDGFLVSSEKLV